MARASGRTLKSPLAAPGGSGDSYRAVKGATADAAAVAEYEAALDDRASTMAEFEGYLRTVNNRDGRPYEEKTIAVYLGPVKNLDSWMTANGIEGDFTEADTDTLNRYFRDYYLEHGQGGTHTLLPAGSAGASAGRLGRGLVRHTRPRPVRDNRAAARAGAPG